MVKVKCQFCKKEIDRDTAYHNGHWYYCNETCYKNKQDKIKYKPKKTINNEVNPRRELTDYIMQIYINKGYDKHNIPWQLLMAQLKNIMDEHKDYNYKAVQYTLWYMNYIKEVDLFSDLSNGSILSLVPFYFQQAKEYCESTIKINKMVNEMNDPNNEIVIKARPYIKRERYKQLDFD